MLNTCIKKPNLHSWSQEAMENAIKEVTELKATVPNAARKYGIPRATLTRYVTKGSCENNKIRTMMNGSWSEETMAKAMQEVLETPKSVNSTAAKYGIPSSTLKDHVNRRLNTYFKKRSRVFNMEQEKELINYLFEMSDVISKEDFLELVFYCAKNGSKNPFIGKAVSVQWFKKFARRHPSLSYKTINPPKTRRLNKSQVNRFFDLLEEQVQKNNVDASRLYNMDKISVHTLSNTPSKIIPEVDKQLVGSITEGRRTTTAICCCNAAGSFIPPFMIFDAKEMNPRLLDGSAPGAQGTCTDNGWVDGPVFMKWLKFFIETVRPTSDKKVIVVLENFEYHMWLSALLYASNHNVIFIYLPQHTRDYVMQALEYGVFSQLKTYFNMALSELETSHPGQIINVASLFSSSYMKAATAENAIEGFRKTGLFPTNRNVFNESDFEATVTENSSNLENAQLEKPQSEISDSNSTLDADQAVPLADSEDIVLL